MQDLYGGLITLVEGDIVDPTVRDHYVKTALALKDEIYGLVALPGDPARVPGGELDGAALEASFRANFEAPFLLAKACAEPMAKKGTRGAIVLVSSMQGVHPFEGSVAYAAPKAALVHAALILAKELGGPSDIRVNVVAPGDHGHGPRVDRIGKVRRLCRARDRPAFRPPRRRRSRGAPHARAGLLHDGPGRHRRRRAHPPAGQARVIRDWLRFEARGSRTRPGVNGFLPARPR
jgi:NAD(P)-dependent dehydrogenase (short-subunit alcohol dehydrogenase family)